MSKHVHEISGEWFWVDETGELSEPYESQALASIDFWRYVHWMETGETL